MKGQDHPIQCLLPSELHHPRSFSRGEVIFQQGEKGDQIRVEISFWARQYAMSNEQ